MAYAPSFPNTRNFFDPPTLAQIIGYVMPWVIWGLKERQKIVAWFEPRCFCISQMGEHEDQKLMRYSEAKDYRDKMIAKKQSLSFQIIDFQVGLFDRFLFALGRRFKED